MRWSILRGIEGWGLWRGLVYCYEVWIFPGGYWVVFNVILMM